MNVVVLKTGLDSRAKFIFKSMEDCEKFKYVFKDHWCNVPWLVPVFVDEQRYLTDIGEFKIIEDPVQAAEDNLSWGFSLCKRYKIEETDEQKAFVRDLINRIESKNNYNY